MRGHCLEQRLDELGAEGTWNERGAAAVVKCGRQQLEARVLDCNVEHRRFASGRRRQKPERYEKERGAQSGRRRLQRVGRVVGLDQRA